MIIKMYKSFGWRGFDTAGMMQISEWRRKSRTAHFLSYSEEMSPSPVRTQKQFFPQLGRYFACNWRPRDTQANTRIAIQIVRGGVIKQMCVDVGLFRALSAVLKPAAPARHTTARKRSLLPQ